MPSILTQPPAPAAVAADPAPVPGLSGEQLRAIGAAKRLARPVRRAAAVATFSAWSLAVFAAFCLLGGLFSLPSLLLGIALAVVARFEFLGARRLRALDAAAPIRLAWNQLALVVIVAAYCTWGILNVLLGPGAYDEYLAAGGQVGEMLEPIDHLTRTVTVLFYATILVLSAIIQTGTACYYFTRRRHVLTVRHGSEPWVIETMQAAGA